MHKSAQARPRARKKKSALSRTRAIARWWEAVTRSGRWRTSSEPTTGDALLLSDDEVAASSTGLLLGRGGTGTAAAGGARSALELAGADSEALGAASEVLLDTSTSTSLGSELGSGEGSAGRMRRVVEVSEAAGAMPSSSEARGSSSRGSPQTRGQQSLKH